MPALFEDQATYIGVKVLGQVHVTSHTKSLLLFNSTMAAPSERLPSG